MRIVCSGLLHFSFEGFLKHEISIAFKESGPQRYNTLTFPIKKRHKLTKRISSSWDCAFQGYYTYKPISFVFCRDAALVHRTLIFWSFGSVKGTGSQDRIRIYGQKWIVLGMNKNLYWFLNFQNAPLMRCRQFHFHQVKGKKICLRPSKMFLLFTEIYWNAVDAIFKHYWRVLTVILKKSSKSFISLKCFQFNRIENENKNCSSEAHLKS